MGASKKNQMRTFAEDWADQIWGAARNRNNGSGAAWLLPLAAIATTGARPAALEKGITFEVVEEDGAYFLQAMIQGVKKTENRSQAWHAIRWSLLDAKVKPVTHRTREFLALVAAVRAAPEQKLTVKYDADAISTRLRELSEQLWPRRKNHITGYCYRELFSSAAKSAGASAEELAIAMGHLSAESQGKYARASKVTSGSKTPQKPWSAVKAASPVKMERAPMARFKATSSMKTRNKLNN